MVLDEDDPIRNAFDIRNDVGGEQNDLIPRKRGDDITEFDPLFWIQPSGGFIQNENFGVVEKSLGDPYPLNHAP